MSSETMTEHRPLLEVRDLTVQFQLARKVFNAVENAAFTLYRGRTLCVVGESGSGKSVTARAILNIPRPAKIVAGQIVLSDLAGNPQIDIAGLDTNGEEIRAIRGGKIAMIFQEPMSSLSPVHTIGEQIIEAIELHQQVSGAEARDRAIQALRRVQISSPETAIDRYPFEFSGGMRQRAMIAMALACKPDVLIADEPTTALDVTTQAEVLKLIKSIQREEGLAVMFITHDLGVVAEIADDIVVMYRGQVVETGPVAQVFENPSNDYTRLLINATRKLESRNAEVAPAVAAAEAPPLIKMRSVTLDFTSHSGLLSRKRSVTRALDDVDLDVLQGENLGIVGESGSGKTTLGRCLMGAYQPSSGAILYRNANGMECDLAQRKTFKDGTIYKEMRMIFQDPYSSLNPRMTVEQIIAEPLKLKGGVSGGEQRDRVASLMRRVGLSPDMMSRYPHAFSGGQRQRIGIARAVAINPRVIIADEATSALDGSIRAQILDLLLELKEEMNLTYIFIGHDIGVIRYFCDRVAVMNKGRVVEIGAASQICDEPQQPYTQQLLSSVPGTDPRAKRILA